MKNFIFKSSDFGLIKNVSNKLDMVLAEQRHQRVDLADIKRLLQSFINDRNLQKTVDKYFDDTEDIPEVEDGNRSSD